MTRIGSVLVLCSAALVAVPAGQPAAEKLDYAAIAQIRDEGLNRSQAMETLFWLLEPTSAGTPPAVDLVSPRLTRRESVLPSSSTQRNR